MSGKSFQRPLPKLRPAGAAAPNLGRTRTQSHAHAQSSCGYSRSDPPTSWFQPPGVQIAGMPGNAPPGSVVVRFHNTPGLNECGSRLTPAYLMLP
jgi:hypothetical protein